MLFEISVVQKVVGLARAARGQSGVRTRQPLSRLLIRAPDDVAAKALAGHQDQILEELKPSPARWTELAALVIETAEGPKRKNR